MNEIVKFNYLLYNKKRGLPDFLRTTIDRETEKAIKDEYRSEYSFKEYYLEKFNIDLNEYAENNRIVEGDFYYLFNMMYICKYKMCNLSYN